MTVGVHYYDDRSTITPDVDLGEDGVDVERRCIRNAVGGKTACFHHLGRAGNWGRVSERVGNGCARGHMGDLVCHADDELMIRLIPGKGDGHWRPDRNPAQRSVGRVDTGMESLADNVQLPWGIGSNTLQVEGRPNVIGGISRTSIEKSSPESRVGPKAGIGGACYFKIASNRYVGADGLDVLCIGEAHQRRAVLLAAIVRLNTEMAMRQV